MVKQSLKEKTASALIWNLLDKGGQQIIIFIVGIIVANILSVEDYALVGMLAIFTAIANIVLDSGFSSALIRKKDTTDTDFNSVFYFNLAASLVLYAILFLSAPYIATFFNQPQLINLARVLFLALPLNSLTIVQSTILSKDIRFKRLAKINVISLLISGFSSLLMAYSGLGVWTLTWQPVILASVRSLLLWANSPWRPGLTFSTQSIKDMFGFASGLLVASLINTIFLNIYSVVLGKIYPAKQLGYYTQGSKMSDMGITMLYSSIQTATYPIFSNIQDDKERLLRAYRKTIRFTSFLIFPVIAGLILTASPTIEILLKEEWYPCIPFFQLLCLGGGFTILTAINNNFIKVGGRSDILLILEIIKILITVICLLFTIHKPALIMVSGLVATRLAVYLITIIFVQKYIRYTLIMQLKDIFPYLLFSVIMYLILSPLSNWITNNLLLLPAQITGGFMIYFLLAKCTGSKILDDTIDLILKRKKESKK